MTKLRVLVGCEFSGIVRDAFRALGHDAYSCDLLPCESDPSFHIQANCLELLADGWDLLVAFPPCTYLCLSGVRWLYGGKGKIRDPKRWALMEQGALFFKALWEAPIPRIAVENPMMHRHAASLIGVSPIQWVEPWMFGHGETKRTGLWLKNLPLLQPTNIVAGRNPRVHHASPGPDRWKERSRTVRGLALAMAEQWSFT